jgi:hypothetical protein
MKWQNDRTPFFEEECRAIRKTFPDVELLEVHGLIFLRGDFPVHDNNGTEVERYRLEIWFPHNYPDLIPKVVAIDKRIQPIADRHVFRNRVACLCLPHEIARYLPKISFMLFWENLLKFWLIGQACYDQNGVWPFKARPHNSAGIYEGFSELLGLSDQKAVKNFTSLLLRKNPAKGHELCPCGSGLKLRDCHQSEYQRVRFLLMPDVLNAYRKHLQ